MFGRKSKKNSGDTAEIYKRMVTKAQKRPLSVSMGLSYPGDEKNDGLTEPSFEIPSPAPKPRVVLHSGLNRTEEVPVRRFTLSSIKPKGDEAPPRSYPSLSFPDLRLAENGFSAEEKPAGPEPEPEPGEPPLSDRDPLENRNPAKEEFSLRNRPGSSGTIMEVNQLFKGYVKGKNLIPVLNGVDIRVRDGEFLAIVGQSGSGKSTLLHLMGTLDVPDSGTVHFDGQRIDNLPSRRRDFLRNRYIGMIFQFYHLIPEMSMIENVLAPMMVRHSLFGYLRRRREYTDRAKELLDLVGLSHRMKHRPNELSGGEMQRTSIARALITDPRVLLADEPTGNLDSKTTVEIIKLLRSLNAEKKLTIIMVTHDMEQARDADRVIRLVDGQVVESFSTGI